MAIIIQISDLPDSLKTAELIEVMVDGANAKASRVAPCLDDEPTDEQLAEARMVLIGAVKRWVQAGSGAYSQQTAGPFSVSTDTRQRTGYNLWPSEISDLQSICSTGEVKGAFSVDTAPGPIRIHTSWCDVTWGSTCSCGAILAGHPIYEFD